MRHAAMTAPTATRMRATRASFPDPPRARTASLNPLLERRWRRLRPRPRRSRMTKRGAESSSAAAAVRRMRARRRRQPRAPRRRRPAERGSGRGAPVGAQEHAEPETPGVGRPLASRSTALASFHEHACFSGRSRDERHGRRGARSAARPSSAVIATAAMVFIALQRQRGKCERGGEVASPREHQGAADALGACSGGAARAAAEGAQVAERAAIPRAG